MRLVLAVTVVLAVGLLSACSDGYEFNFPENKRIDVDTPKLRKMKADAGVEPCEPGEHPGASDLPEVPLPCFGGGPDVDLSTLEGPLVVNFWAGWCEPCREEMPALQEFHEKYGDRVPVVGINRLDPQVERAMQLVVETGVTYPLLADPEELLPGQEPLGAMKQGLPLFALVNPDGSVELAVARPAITSLADVEALVEEHSEIEL